MDKKEEFKHYMLAGHGRAAILLKNSIEDFRDILLYGCLNDISFDMQCEGSRGYYMYNLVWEYGEIEWFLEKAVDKFLTDDINEDWHIICHLGDFIRLFWENDSTKTARSAIAKKYCDVYSEIMTEENAPIDCFEYLAITLMQIGDFKLALKIFGDIGEYFLNREETPDEDLKWLFAWFYSETKEKYGEDFLKEELEKHSKDSEEIRRFNRVMNTPDKQFEKKERPSPTAENLVKLAKENKLQIRDIVYFKNRLNEEEKIKIANAVVAESDLTLKTKLLNIFRDNNPFPLDPAYLVEYASLTADSTDNRTDDIQFINTETNLHDAALRSMSCIRADCVRDFAVEMIDKDDSEYLLHTLIYNCRESDREIIFNRLNKLDIDLYDETDWHGVIFKIIDAAREIDTPNSLLNDLLMFAYEKSLCSCCRENIVDELAKRNLMSDDMIAECRFDSNIEIREKVDNLTKNSSVNS